MINHNDERFEEREIFMLSLHWFSTSGYAVSKIVSVKITLKCIILFSKIGEKGGKS